MWYNFLYCPEQCEEADMKNGKMPDPNTIHPIAGYDQEIFVKPTITNPNILHLYCGFGI